MAELAERYPDKGYSANSAGRALTEKTDGLASCLSRILSLAHVLNENNGRLSSIADQLRGPRPEQSGTEKVQAMPDNALFLAKHIENTLQSIIDTQRDQLNLIESALS